MSALSFLSKKSWHTGLQTNQEAVWKAEKAALEERQKLDELRKERDRERELQELERLHEESGGKKARRQERVDWMYNAPASGSHVDKDELEDYLLGKKRVDKLLKGDESNQVSRQGAGPSRDPISTQSNVNSDRDLASKIREDPMFAIRQQEQAAYQALLKDPARLRAMRKAAGMEEGKDGSKEERRRRKEERRRRKEGRHHRSADGERYWDEEEGARYSRRQRDDVDEHRHTEGEGRKAGSERQPRHHEGRTRSGRESRHDDRDRRSWADSVERRDPGPRSAYDQRKESFSHNGSSMRRSRSRSPSRQHEHHRRARRSPSPRMHSRGRVDHSYPPRDAGEVVDSATADRAAKLAAMQQNAADLTTTRSAYLAKVQAEEQADHEREQALRAKLQEGRGKLGFGSEAKGSFIVEQERNLYGSGSNLDLAERLRRGRDGLQRFDGD